MAGVKLYDVANDAIITDRAEIIDHLVRAAARILTFAAPVQEREVLSAAASSGWRREKSAMAYLVKALWRADVTAA